MRIIRGKRVFQLAVAVLLVFAIGGGAFTTQRAAHARAAAPQTFIVMAGAAGPANMEVLAFFPKELQVHQGDTVIWLINGFHNVRFADEEMAGHEAPLFMTSEVDGETVTQINPAVAFPTIQSGAAYTGGEAGSGLPQGGAPFSLVIDAAPGTYHYHCDIHEAVDPNAEDMDGAIIVVDDATEISSPTDVMLEAAKEMGDQIGQGMGAYEAALEQSMAPMEGGTAHVMAGTEGGLASMQAFFPAVTVIHAGDSVQWSVTGKIEVHTVSWPEPPEDQQTEFRIAKDGTPMIVALPAFIQPTIQDGGDWIADGYSHSGILATGKSFTARFPNPGVYPYVCNLHPGMAGTVVVLPAE